MRSEIQALATETKNISGTTQQIYDDLQEMSKDSKQQHYEVTGTTRRMEGKLDDLTKNIERLERGKIYADVADLLQLFY